MVEDTGKAVRSVTLKPVNQPEPENVEENAAGLPVALETKHRQPVRPLTTGGGSMTNGGAASLSHECIMQYDLPRGRS